MHRIIDRLRRQTDLFQSPKSSKDYVGSYDVDIEKIEQAFLDDGWTPNPVSYVSYKKEVGHEKATFAWRKSPLATWQYHVVLFTYWNGVRVYCHKEYNWIRHPILHLLKRDIAYAEGIHAASSVLRDAGLYGEFIPDLEKQ